MERGILGKEYAHGEVFCCQGESGDRMYILQSGRAEVVRVEEGVEVVMGELQPGDIFGEMSIFDREPRSATVRSKGTSRALSLDKRAFMRNVHEDPSLAFRILQGMSRRIRGLDRELSRMKAFSILPRNEGGEGGYLFIVSPDQPELLERLTQDFKGNKMIRVIVDRRNGSRRQRAQAAEHERRASDRRNQEGTWDVQLARLSPSAV